MAEYDRSPLKVQSIGPHSEGIVLKKDVRDHLGVKKGDYVVVKKTSIDGKKVVIIRRVEL